MVLILQASLKSIPERILVSSTIPESEFRDSQSSVSSIVLTNRTYNVILILQVA